tara:strand:- start:2932 stop:3810 length:879 start_codon:yes stop_codon:yes gene_type:complete
MPNGDDYLKSTMSTMDSAKFVPDRNMFQSIYHLWKAASGQSSSFYGNDRLQSLLHGVFSGHTVSVPVLTIGVTDTETLEQHHISLNGGEPININLILASCSLPGLFPPVSIFGHRFIDGGIRRGFVRQSVVNSLRNNDIQNVLLLGCSPWSGKLNGKNTTKYDVTSLLARIGLTRWFENLPACTKEYLSIIQAGDYVPDGRAILLCNGTTLHKIITPDNGECASASEYTKAVILAAPTEAEFATIMDVTLLDSPERRRHTSIRIQKYGRSAADELNAMMARCGLETLRLKLT